MCLTFSRTRLLFSNFYSTFTDWFTMIKSPILFTKAPGLTGYQAAAKATIAKNMHVTRVIFTCKRNKYLCPTHSAFRQHIYKIQFLMRFHLCKLMAKLVFYNFLISSCNHGFRRLMQCDLFLSVHYLFLPLHDLFRFPLSVCVSVLSISVCSSNSFIFVCLSSSA